MAHDPLCPDTNSCECYKDGSGIHSCGWGPCQCDLITAAHERGYKEAQNFISSKIIKYGEDTHIPHSPRIACQRCDIVAAYNYAAQIARGG